jgi:hypothetical protein
MPKIPYKAIETPEYLKWKEEQNTLEEKKKQERVLKKAEKAEYLEWRAKQDIIEGQHLMDPADVRELKKATDAKYGKHASGGYSKSDRICYCGYHNINDINAYMHHFQGQHHKKWMDRPKPIKPVKAVVYGFDD